MGSSMPRFGGALLVSAESRKSLTPDVLAAEASFRPERADSSIWRWP